MQISVIGRHVDVPASLKAYAEEKSGKLPRYFDRIQSVQVIVDRDGDQVSVEMLVSAAGTVDFVAKEVGPEAHACIDLLVDKLERQLTRHKERVRSHKHPG